MGDVHQYFLDVPRDAAFNLDVQLRSISGDADMWVGKACGWGLIRAERLLLQRAWRQGWHTLQPWERHTKRP